MRSLYAFPARRAPQTRLRQHNNAHLFLLCIQIPRHPHALGIGVGIGGADSVPLAEHAELGSALSGARSLGRMVYAAALAPALYSSGAGSGGALRSAGSSVANRFFSRRSACNDCEPRQGGQGKVVIDGIDANGMLNVSASNKTLCKFDRTISTDDKDRSSNEEIGCSTDV